MRKLAVVAAGLLFITPALAQSLSEKSGVNAMVGITPSTADFVTEAAQSDMFEIQSSQLAQQKATGPMRDFAARMITDHQKTTGELMSMAQGGTMKVTMPTGMASSQQKMLDHLKDLSGGAFMTEYQEDQVSAHKDAVSLFQRYASGGENADLKGWAGKTLPVLQSHLKMAQDLGA